MRNAAAEIDLSALVTAQPPACDKARLLKLKLPTLYPDRTVLSPKAGDAATSPTNVASVNSKASRLRYLPYLAVLEP